MGRRIDREVSGLERVVALLLMFARLAEAAAGAPWPVRRAILWVLRRVEARATDFAAGYAFHMGLPGRPVLAAFDGDDPEAARSLALALRMLALAIRDMRLRLGRRRPLSGRRAVAGRADRHPRRPIGLSPATSAAPPDTS